MSYSHIAAALARLRGEKPSVPPPEVSDELPPLAAPSRYSFSYKSAATPPVAKTFPWRLTFFGLALVSLAAGSAWWLMLPGEPARTEARQAPRPVVVSTPPAMAIETAPSPSAALTEVVRTLAVSAAMAAPNPRVIVAGKVYLPGDAVAEGLVLQEIHPGLLVFCDRAGALYTRRF